MHYGVLVQDFWKGSVILKHTLVQYNCNFGIYIHAKEPPKERAKPNQRSLNIQSVDKAHEDSVAKMFKGMHPLLRRGTFQVSPSMHNHQFNMSTSSHNGAGLTNTLKKKTIAKSRITRA